MTPKNTVSNISASRLNLILQTLEAAASSANPTFIFSETADDLPDRFVTAFKLGTAFNPARQIEQKLIAIVRKADQLIKAEFASNSSPTDITTATGGKVDLGPACRAHYDGHELG